MEMLGMQKNILVESTCRNGDVEHAKECFSRVDM